MKQGVGKPAKLFRVRNEGKARLPCLAFTESRPARHEPSRAREQNVTVALESYRNRCKMDLKVVFFLAGLCPAPRSYIPSRDSDSPSPHSATHRSVRVCPSLSESCRK